MAEVGLLREGVVGGGGKEQERWRRPARWRRRGSSGGLAMVFLKLREQVGAGHGRAFPFSLSRNVLLLLLVGSPSSCLPARPSLLLGEGDKRGAEKSHYGGSGREGVGLRCPRCAERPSGVVTARASERGERE